MLETTAPGVDALSRQLLRKGVALRADRDRCTDCRRTPLVGERVYCYAPGEIVCALCRPLRRREPAGWEPVRTGAHGHTVRPTARAA